MGHTETSTLFHGKELLETALNAIPLAILLIDSTLEVRWVNRRGEALFGRERESVVGQSVETVKGGLWVWSDGPDFDDRLRTLFRGGDSICEEERRCTILGDGKKTECYFRINASPMMFANDKMVLIALEDITLLKVSEKENTEREKLSLTIQMARATTHDLNQPLSVLVGNLDLLMRHLEANGSFKDRIDRISKSADRVTEVVRRLQMIIRSPRKGDFLKSSRPDTGKASLIA